MRTAAHRSSLVLDLVLDLLAGISLSRKPLFGPDMRGTKGSQRMSSIRQESGFVARTAKYFATRLLSDSRIPRLV
jgi:hypothetical protein